MDLTATKDCRCLAARRSARAITRLFDERLRPHGLRATQFSILAALALKGPTPVGELAEFLGIDRTTLTRSAAILQKRKWVAEAPARDARERLFKITAAGRRKIHSAYPAWKAGQDAVDAQTTKANHLNEESIP